MDSEAEEPAVMRLDDGAGGFIEVKVEVAASGYKSSEGDGRTAADIEAEREAQKALKE